MVKIKARVGGIREKAWLNWLVAGLCLLLLPFVYQALTEFVRMQSVTRVLEYLWLRRRALAPGYLVLFAVFAAITFISRRPWVANAIMGLVTFLAALSHFFKLVNRGDPLVPKDLVQISEAIVMTGEMKIYFTRELWLYLVFWLLSTLLLVPFALPLGKGWKHWVVRLCVPVASAVFVPLFIFGFMGNRTVMNERYNIHIKPVHLADTYYMGSFYTSFFYLLGISRQTPPPEYSEASMRQLAAELPAGEGRRPDIIVVMMESFYDVAAIEGTSYSEPLMPNYERLAGEGITGTVLVDKYGGGTSDYEFSALSGFSTSLLPIGSVPYIEYIEPGFPCLPNFYRERGYRTLAIHPYYENFYNRNKSYPHMGFETFCTLDDFWPEDELGTYVSDEAFVRRIIEEYEKSAAQGQPVFIHGVSMQNHLPYEPDTYPARYGVQAKSGTGDAWLDGSLSTLATGVRDADRALGLLVDYFSGVQGDVVLLFFGDHQSGATNEHDEDLVYQTEGYLSAGPEEQWLMTHSTPYLMWSNYRTFGTSEGQLTPYMLMPVLLESYGVEAPPWFLWLAAGRDVLPGHISGYWLQPGGGISAAPAPGQEARWKQQELFQYDAMFGKQYVLEEMYR